MDGDLQTSGLQSFSAIRSFRTSASSIAKDVIFSFAASTGGFYGRENSTEFLGKKNPLQFWVTNSLSNIHSWKIHSDPWSILLRFLGNFAKKFSLQPPSSTPLLWDLGGASTHQLHFQKASKNYTISSKIIQKSFKDHSKFVTSHIFETLVIHISLPPQPSNATNSALLAGLQAPLCGPQLCPATLKQLSPASCPSLRCATVQKTRPDTFHQILVV